MKLNLKFILIEGKKKSDSIMNKMDRGNFSLICNQFLKSLSIYIVSVSWTIGVFVYSSLTNTPDIFLLTAGLLFLLIASSLLSKNKSINTWILNFLIIFFLGGLTIFILNETRCIAQIICLFSALLGHQHNLCPCEI
jgi:hypothetical protein